ncbi:sperm-associated antigen 11A-like [Tenrec ecaudatus]|uniref:sperm-associated antigen 11A-like n=1 Tax=Tenrec ecaudatus TaxID=94439 RepID=UPI003F590CD2
MKVLFLLALLFSLAQNSSGDMPPGIRNTVCLLQHGTCRLFFCRSGEKKGEICSDPWNRCCTPEEENGGKTETAEKSDGNKNVSF